MLNRSKVKAKVPEISGVIESKEPVLDKICDGRVSLKMDVLVPMSVIYPEVGKSPVLYDREIHKDRVFDEYITLMLSARMIKEYIGEEWESKGYCYEYFYDYYFKHKDEFESEEYAMGHLINKYDVLRDHPKLDKFIANSNENMDATDWASAHFWADTGEVTYIL